MVHPNGEFSAASTWAREELSLPIFESLREQEVEYVASHCQA
jgi:dTDP-4-amino-4,6-dideoxygalactose transaminase